MMKLSSLLLVTCSLLPSVAAHAAEVATTAPTRFDPARHMRVSEVREGMTGYGLSVFKGTQIERFDVKVLSVLKNFNPKYDVVLIDCKGANLEHTGAIAGMSGSPIFLKDDQGRERMIGAFAYGWPMVKDPVAGVQPIEYMLGISESKDLAGGPVGEQPKTQVEKKARWSIDDCRLDLRAAVGRASQATRLKTFAGDGSSPRLMPLATPLMTAGISPKVLEEFAPVFRAAGLVPLQGGIGGGSAMPGGEPAKLEPGSVLGVPLITGDVEMTAVGTCTEVLGDRIWGFGHAFNNEGAITLPMGSGQISAVIANLNSSFKLGSLTKVRGTLTADQTVGVAGRIGTAPAMVPMEIAIAYPDGSNNQTYHFNAASHPKLTPLIAAAAIQAVLGGTKELPQYHTLDYDLNLEFANGQTVNVNNRAVNVHANELFFEIGTPIIAASDNPFGRVTLKRLTGKINVTPEARDAKILSVNLPKTKYQPGDIAKVFVTYRPFRGDEAVLPLEFEMPRDLPDGNYQLFVTDWDTYLEQERLSRPFRFTAESADEVFAVLKDLFSVKHNALYLRLVRQADGVAIGRTAMPKLPSSRRQVLLGAGLSNTTPFVSSNVKIVATDVVMDGATNFAITVAREAKVEGGSGVGKPMKHDAKPPVVTPKSDEKPKPAAKPDAPIGAGSDAEPAK
jgi:hypothetical protein